MKNVYKRVNRQSGAVLLLVLAVISIVIPLIQGVWMDSQIEYRFSRYRMNELQARYSAKSGVGLSLLRLYIFKGAEKSLSGQLESMVRPFLDMIWSFPFVWPIPISEDLLESEKEEIQNLMNQSFLKGAYATSILPEDGLLDVNDLSSPLISLREFTYTALFNLLMDSLEEKPELRDRYDERDFEEILNNLSDWTDLDNDSQNGGREDFLEEGKRPLNRSFVSIEEIQKVPRVNREIFDILSPHITVYGAKALNINYSSMEILKALNIPEMVAEQIVSRTKRDSIYYKPFVKRKEFCDFVDELNFSFCEALKETYNTLDILRFSYPVAFRIKSSGEYRGSFVNREALLYDLTPMALDYQKSRYYQIQRQKQAEGKLPSELSAQKQETDDSQKTQTKQPKFDYSSYKSLIIMYMKESS